MENNKTKTEFAACEYCGQYNTVSVPDNATQEEIRDAAIEVCNCSDAEIQKKRKNARFYRHKLALMNFSEIMRKNTNSLRTRKGT